MPTEPSASGEREATLDGIDNPIERLRLRSGNDDEIARYLDTIEVRSQTDGHQPNEIHAEP